MGKAENNFENKWLEEREDGFFYLTEIDNLDIEKLTTILNSPK